MPTYKNNTSEPIKVDIFNIAAGESKELNFYHNIAGLDKTLDTPFTYNPVLLHSVETGDTDDVDTVDIPSSATEDYEIQVNVLAGSCKLYFNSLDNTPPVELSDGFSWKRTIRGGRRVDCLKIKYTSDSSEVDVRIEKINP